MASVDFEMSHSYFLILLVSLYALIRGTEIVFNPEGLESISRIYTEMAHDIPVSVFGLLLIFPSILLITTLFLYDKSKLTIFAIGNMILAIMHLFYASYGVGNANFNSTVLLSLLFASIQFMMFVSAVINYWQLNNEIVIKDIDKYDKRK